jgi:DNA-binding NarL/FixJ family response regulator
MPIPVLICDDQAVVREGLAAILSTDPDIQVVGLAANGKEAVELVAEMEPHVVLMDLKMPVMNGVKATQQMRELRPEASVLVLTTYEDDDWLFDAIRAGASGYLLKDTRRDDLIAAIKGVAEGRSFLDPTIAGKVMQHVANTSSARARPEGPSERLTERELDVLRLLAEGHSNPEIAARLHLAPGTVRNYVSGILQKLGVSDRTQAALVALKGGLVDGSKGET